MLIFANKDTEDTNKYIHFFWVCVYDKMVYTKA